MTGVKNKVVMALVSLVIAFGLWLYVMTVEDPEFQNTYHDVHVVLEGEAALTERGLMLTDGFNPTVTLELKGNRTNLNKLNGANITLIADLSRIYEAGEQTLRYTISYPGDIPNNSITVLSHMPDQIKVKVENRITKAVPVKINYAGAVPEGFISDRQNAVLDYSVVNVTGPASVVDQIQSASIDVDLEGRTESVSESYRYVLCNEAGEPVDAAMIQTNVEEVRLDLRIERMKEVTLKLNVIDGGGATEQTSQITIEPAVIRVSGNDTLLAGLDELVVGTINLGELTKATQLTMPIVLPEGVTNWTGVTEAAIDVQFPDLLTREFEITKFQALNVPKGLTAQVVTKTLTVAIRGPREVMEAMKKSDVAITVDFSGLQAGTTTLKANVVLGPNFTTAGPVGTYIVSATLKVPEPEPTDPSESTAPTGTGN